jgi:hypothetical protein
MKQTTFELTSSLYESLRNLSEKEVINNNVINAKFKPQKGIGQVTYYTLRHDLFHDILDSEQNRFDLYPIKVTEEELSILMWYIDNSEITYKEQLKYELQCVGNREFGWKW